MNQINFEKYDPSNVEIGQIRESDNETIMVVESETVDCFERSEYPFNAIVMSGGMKFRTLYTTPQSAREIIRNHPKLIDVHEIKIITKDDI